MKRSEFSIAALIKARVANTWDTVKSHERTVSERLAEKYGLLCGADGVPHGGVRIPSDALYCRDMTAMGPASAGGFLVGTDSLSYLAALKPASATLRLGVQVEQAPGGHIVVPKGTSSATIYWLSDEATAITESQPTIAQISSTPKICGAYVQVTHQLLLQSNAEEVLRRELRNAAATALDVAILAGTGAAGQPTGLTLTSGIGTFTGASLTYAGALDATQDVAASAVNADTLGWTCTPAVATVLCQRVKLAATQPFLWEGNSIAGTMLGARALSTANAPAATLFFGDWSACTVFEWGEAGLQIQVDPYTNFSTGLVNMRILVPLDIAFTRPSAFSIGTSVS